MRVLVTGGAGYIGAHTVRRLQDRGDAVVVVDDLTTGDAARLRDVELARIDLADPACVPELARVLDGVDAVIHFAALKRVDESFDQPERYERVNVGGVRNLLDAMNRAEVRRLVFSSTAAVYGQVDGVVGEDAPVEPISPYGRTKGEAEGLIAQESARGSLAAASLRYFNVAGTGSADLREHHAMNLIPQALRRLDAGDRPQVFGSDYPTPDGTCVRDYIHVLDVSDAHLAVLDALDAPGHRVYNVGTGRGSSVLEVLRALIAARSSDVEPELLDRRPGDPAIVVADVRRITEELEWTARHDLADIVASAVASDD